MTYRSLLVFVDQDPLCAARSPGRNAARQRPRLPPRRRAPTGFIDLPAAPQAATPLAELAAHARDTLRDQAEQAAQSFRQACRAAGIKSFEAVVDESDKAPSIVRHAHCSDLTVLTQADPTVPGHRLTQDIVELVVLYSARPTLILPCVGRFDTVGTNVMVAWDDSREAARALSDALPLLRLAKRVQVVRWNEAGFSDDKMLRQRLDALHQWLMWQGVSADVRVETTQIGIADAMLSRAADLSADLIVMGAYGYPRWSERVLGGATRGLLASMTVPVLMSH